MARGAINHFIDIEKFEKEEWLQNLLEKLESPRFTLDYSIIKEMNGISSSSSRKFGSNGLPRLPVVRDKSDLHILMEENASCLASRDRVTEILVSYTAIRYALDALWEQAEAKLLEYDDFKQLTNEQSRKAFITAVLQPLHKKRNHVRQVIATAEIMQEHLSHTHFTIKQHSEMGVAILGLRSS